MKSCVGTLSCDFFISYAYTSLFYPYSPFYLPSSSVTYFILSVLMHTSWGQHSIGIITTLNEGESKLSLLTYQKLIII